MQTYRIFYFLRRLFAKHQPLSSLSWIFGSWSRSIFFKYIQTLDQERTVNIVKVKCYWLRDQSKDRRRKKLYLFTFTINKITNTDYLQNSRANRWRRVYYIIQSYSNDIKIYSNWERKKTRPVSTSTCVFSSSESEYK